MKKFAGHKSLDVIRAQCKAAGVHLNTRLYDERGDDSVSIWTRVREAGYGDSDGGFVIYNLANGRFYGRTPMYSEPAVSRFRVEWPSHTPFSSDSTEFEDDRWFQQLLAFFYVEKGEPGAERRPATGVDLTLGGIRNA